MSYYSVSNGIIMQNGGSHRKRSSSNHLKKHMMQGGSIVYDLFDDDVLFIPKGVQVKDRVKGVLWGRAVNVAPKEIEKTSIPKIEQLVKKTIPPTSSATIRKRTPTTVKEPPIEPKVIAKERRIIEPSSPLPPSVVLPDLDFEPPMAKHVKEPEMHQITTPVKKPKTKPVQQIIGKNIPVNEGAEKFGLLNLEELNGYSIVFKAITLGNMTDAGGNIVDTSDIKNSEEFRKIKDLLLEYNNKYIFTHPKEGDKIPVKYYRSDTNIQEAQDLTTEIKEIFQLISARTLQRRKSSATPPQRTAKIKFGKDVKHDITTENMDELVRLKETLQRAYSDLPSYLIKLNQIDIDRQKNRRLVVLGHEPSCILIHHLPHQDNF